MGDALALAERAVTLARAEPARARAMAAQAVKRARREHDVVAESVGHRALALAAREAHDLVTARQEADLAVALAEATGDRAVEGWARSALGGVHAWAGAVDEALAEFDRAARLAPAAPIRFQRATILHRMHRLDEALAEYGAAASAARRAGDRLTLALTLGNRGILHATADRIRPGGRDLAEAEAIFDELGMDLMAADARHNRGFVAATAGDLSLALELYREARRDYERLGVERPNALLDEARALFEANLLDDARATASAAVAGLRASGQGVDLAEALLLLAEVAAAAGRPDPGAATEAERLFRAQGRPSWATLAAFAALRAGDGVAPARARKAADALAAEGWTDAALDARLLAGGRADLEVVAAHRSRGPVLRRVRGWHALARLRVLDGDAAGASRAAAAGVRLARRNAASLAATELRARAAVIVEPLLALGTGLALASRDGRRVLAWAERGRADTLATPIVDAPADPALTELRGVLRRLDGDVPDHERTALERRRRRLETTVDRNARAGRGRGAETADALDIAGLVDALGDRVLVELVVHGGAAHRVSVGRGGVRLHPPVPLDAVVREIRGLRLAAGRVARPDQRSATLAASAAAAVARLDALLLGDVELGDEVVVVPSGPLHGVPWALLPSCAARPCAVAPSSRLWLDGATGRRRRPRRALVVAYGVPGGDVEIDAVRRPYAEVEVLTGDDATTARVLAGLARADVAHLAVHATFRSDNPLYSALHLADGPLLVHDLDRVRRTPPVVVLAACGAGEAAVGAGDQLVGLAAAFLASGTRSLVASVLPVADELAPPVMAAFHAGLQTAGAAAALHAATRAGAHAGTAFTCFGSG